MRRRLWPRFLKTPGLQGAARYEAARALARAGKSEEARKAFLSLYEEARKDEGLLLIDEDFHRALLGDGKEKDEWNPLLRTTARQLIEEKQRPAVLTLARQCWALDDQALAHLGRYQRGARVAPLKHRRARVEQRSARHGRVAAAEGLVPADICVAAVHRQRCQVVPFARHRDLRRRAEEAEVSIEALDEEIGRRRPFGDPACSGEVDALVDVQPFAAGPDHRRRDALFTHRRARGCRGGP